MKLNYAVLAESIYRDEEHKLHIRGAFHQTTLQEMPTQIERAALALEWEASPEEAGSEHHYIVHGTDPAGNRMDFVAETIEVPAEPAIAGYTSIVNTIVVLNGLTLGMPGQHQIQVSLDGEEQCSISLYVLDLRD